jgi:hypothetical protein
MDRFHGTDQIKQMRSPTQDLILKSPPKAGVSKDGAGHRSRLGPILRDASLRDAPQDEAHRRSGPKDDVNMTEQLSAQTFLPHVDKRFRVRGGRHVLTLIQVDASAQHAKGAPRPPFSLIFSGPPGDVLHEGLYALEVEDGPVFDLYLMPIQTRVLGRQDYQAAFN